MEKNKMTKPEIRARLLEMAEEYSLPELRELAEQLHRNSPKHRAQRRSPMVTPEIAEDIRAYAKNNPNLHQQDIAQKFGVNHGRVSEALNNQR